MVSSDSFLCKVLDDPTDWTGRPYSPLESGLPPLFYCLKNETVSHYKDAPWFEEDLSFAACAFTSYLQACFQDDFETQVYEPQWFACPFGFEQGVLGHFSTPTPPATVASLAFNSENLIKVLVLGSKIPLASPSSVGLPSPRFKSWWFGVREHVRSFGESGSQHVDIPLIFQGDLTLKLFVKAKPLTIKRKGKNVMVPAVKKPRVCTFLPLSCFFCNVFLDQ